MITYRVAGADERTKALPFVLEFCAEERCADYQREALFENIERGDTQIIFAENGRGIVGAGGYLETKDGRLGEFIYVWPGYRMQGIARGLLAKMTGGGKFRLIATDWQRAMYERQGWRVTHYVMEREG